MATNREEVSELVKQSETLTKIRFLFELPAELKLKIEAKDFIGAVDDYQRANDVLVNYKNHPSFQSIQDVSKNYFKIHAFKIKIRNASKLINYLLKIYLNHLNH